MKLHIIRHGETIENKTGVVQGWHGGTLTELGEQQALAAGPKVAELQPTIIFSSDLHRTQQTTTQLLQTLGDVPVLFDWRLRERAFGEAEGNPQSNYDWEQILAFTNNQNIEGVETKAHFMNRIRRLIDDLKDFTFAHDSVLVVTHGGVLNVFAAIADPDHKWQRYENTEILSIELAQLM